MHMTHQKGIQKNNTLWFYCTLYDIIHGLFFTVNAITNMSYLAPELKYDIFKLAVSCYTAFLLNKEDLVPSLNQHESREQNQEDDFFLGDLELPDDPERLEGKKSNLCRDFKKQIDLNLYLSPRKRTLINQVFLTVFHASCAYQDWSFEFSQASKQQKINYFQAKLEEHFAQYFTFKLEGPRNLSAFAHAPSSPQGQRKRKNMMDTIDEENLPPDTLNTLH
jgi:hypothetical protein